MRDITKDHADKIRRKLKMKVKSGSKHDIAQFWYNKKIICSFGIRRGSKRNIQHSFIPDQIHVSHSQALALAQCPMSRDEWIQLMVEKGVIVE